MIISALMDTKKVYVDESYQFLSLGYPLDFGQWLSVNLQID